MTRSPMARGYLAMSSWHISSRDEVEEQSRDRRWEANLGAVDRGVVEDVERAGGDKLSSLSGGG